MSIKVSIIIPVYNCQRFLKRCLDSVLKQTLKEIEIIIINDGSTDNSERIIKSYKDERIKYIYQNNKGVSTARNKGLEISKGKYVGFIDSDDWIDDDFYEKLYNSAEKYAADIAVSEIIRLHKFNKKYYLKFQNETVTNKADEKFHLCDVPEKSYVWNKIYRLDSLKYHNILFEENKIYEDVVFTPEALYKLNYLVTVPGINYYYWRHSGSLVTKRSKISESDSKYMHQKAQTFINIHNINAPEYKIEKYGLLGVSILKIKTKGIEKECRLFNIRLKNLTIK